MYNNPNLEDPTKGPLSQDEPLLPQQANIPPDYSPSASTTWPKSKTFLGVGSSKKILHCSFDIVAALSSALFFVLAGSAFRLNNQAVTDSAWGDRVIQAAKIGTTVYPILFASVLGRAIKSIARWRMEKGGTLRVLELLMGSQTLGSTLATQISLGWVSPLVLGVGLTALWLLSPLGGQASLNLLGKIDVDVQGSTPVRYLDTSRQRSTLSDWFSPELIYGALYLSSLLSPTQNSSMDTWGNIKIPRLESLNPADASEGEWVSLDGRSVPYSSLMGIPVVGIPRKGTIEFSLESTYFVLDCQDILRMTLQEIKSNGFLGGLFSVDEDVGRSTFILDSTHPSPRNLTPEITRRYISFASKCDADSYATSNCSVIQSYVETKFRCNSGDCKPILIRKSQGLHDPAAYTGMDKERNMDRLAKYWSMQGRFGSSLENEVSTLTERFIYDPSTTFSAAYSTGPPVRIKFEDDPVRAKKFTVDISTLSTDNFTTRFNLALNTYWIAALAPQYMSGKLPEDPQKLNLNTNQSGDYYDWTSPINISFAARESIATTSMPEERYVCFWVWMWILVGTTSALLISSVAGTYLRWLCMGPDILGYVSSLAMDNPYVPLPPGGCTLDGSERAKLMAHMNVGLMDVKGNDNIGHIAFSSLLGPYTIRKLEKGRQYMGC